MKIPYLLTRAFSTICILAFATLATSSLSAANFELLEHRIEWKGSTPIKSHEGLLSPKSFEVTIGADGTIDSLSVVIDMDSIDVTDISGNKRDKLMGHLRKSGVSAGAQALIIGLLNRNPAERLGSGKRLCCARSFS